MILSCVLKWYDLHFPLVSVTGEGLNGEPSIIEAEAQGGGGLKASQFCYIH